MTRKKDIGSPKQGMNRDNSPFDLSKTEYSFMLNGNFQDEHGSGSLNLQNEPSNIYCTGFKSGFKVIGHKYDINADKTYFFLTNPDTGCSEIGYISSFYNLDGIDQVEDSCGCKISVVLENPLEDQIQEATCEYVTLISDYCTELDEPACTGCLNFSIDHPIFETNIELKDEVSGTVLYWADGYNPDRYLKLDRLEIYTQYEDKCADRVVNTCLDCDKLRVWPLFNKPCLQVDKIENGGNLRAGMYEALIAYCNSNGDELSDYFSLTNPIAIYDRNNNILDQTNLDYQTNFAIRLNVIDADDSYEFFKIAIIYRNGLDGAISARDYNIYSINTTSVSVNTLEDKEVLDVNDLLSRRVHYLHSRGLASGNGYLFHYGMTAHRTVNLQPVVNLMGMFVKWSTVQANEDLYLDGSNISKYRAYMRDEVEPLSIKFCSDGGYETPNFLFIPRPPRPDEVEVLGEDYAIDSNNSSVLEYNPDCTGNDRNKRWQFENTAKVEGRCLIPSNSPIKTVTVEVEEESTCIVTDESGNFVTVAADNDGGTVNIEDYTSLVDYINDHLAEIIASTDPSWADIKAILTDSYPDDHCEPYFGDNCTEPVLTTEEILAYESDGLVLTVGSIDFDEYEHHPTAPSTDSCNIYDLDNTTTPFSLQQDSSFETAYMRAGEVVYLRNPAPSNVNCANAVTPLQYIYTTGTQLDNPFFLQYDGTLGSGLGQAGLQDTKTITGAGVDTANGYTAKLHTNAQWYKVDFNGNDFVVVELTDALIGTTDDICQNTVRLSFFTDCSAASDVSGYSTIIADITLASDPNKMIVLAATDFGGTSGSAYIAVDSPIYCDSLGEITFSGTSGTCDVVIDSDTYTATWNTDVATTVSDFITAHAANMLANNNVILSAGSTSAKVELRSTCAQYTAMTVTNQTGNLAGVKAQLETFHTLRPPCGCINFFSRAAELTTTATYTNVTFIKRETYTATCSYEVPDLKGCNPIPYEYGTFSYWESTERYPCNKELWDSSSLVVDVSTLSGINATDLSYFENYYTSGSLNGNYILNSDTDFRDRPIRHYKFPCSTIVPFMSKKLENPGAFKDSVIYPIGFSIDNEVIRAFLDVAVDSGLLTLEERVKITRYEIFRGDRSVDKSIVAKGLLFDMYEAQDSESTTAIYPNYPLNALGSDNLNGAVPHSHGSKKNDVFTFHSPDTHFYNPTLPNEMKIEGYQFGKSGIYFDVVRDHPTYVILGNAAYNTATGLAIAEVTLDLLVQGLSYALEATAAGTAPGIAGSIIIAIGIVVALTGGMFKVGELRYQWIENLRALGHPHQFAYYSVAIGHYNYFLPNPDNNETLRGLATTRYLKEGRYSVTNEYTGTEFNVNNLDRERSVFINLGGSYFLNYPTEYYLYDNTTYNPLFCSRGGYTGTGRSGRIVKNAASPYVSLKRYLPAQYGNVQSIDWVHTGFCGNLNEDVGCNPIFGGDTYISRFSLKRKFPFFTSTSHGMAPRTPFEYSDYFNVNPLVSTNRYYVDYLTNDDSDNFFMMFVFPANRSKFNLDNHSGSSGFYIKPPAKFYLYSYGIPYFLVESVINCNYRYAKRERHENFYPNVGDVIEFTQESNVSIREPNTFFYNFVYSGLTSKYPWTMLPDNFDSELYKGLENLDNMVIYSGQDNSDASLIDPWLTYKALDGYTFPKAFGRLIDMDSIESETILARFENGTTLFGAIDQLRDRLTPETKNIGQGGIFAGRSINFNKTDLGYGGTQHKAKVSCKYGHFWVDAKRGKVFNLGPGGEGFKEITLGVSKWFKENLPFKIAQTVSGLTQEAMDNSYKGLGITMGWDDRLERVFLTKLDYKTVRTDISYQYDEVGFFYLDDEKNRIDIDLTDTTYFKDCSFTIAYSPLSDMWISYYSFKPNYYIAYNNYFQTGINYSVDSSEIGLWSHLPFLSSYQVFYGKLYPWIIESPLITKFTNSVLESVEYWMDVKKYYNKYDYSDIYGVGFNKAFIYNSQQNTGQLNLVHQVDDNMQQLLTYPQFNTDSISILQSEINGKWNFNYIYNAIKNERSGAPIWLYDCNQINKELDSRLLDYRSTFKDRLRGDYFILRLQQDIESRFKMIFRFNKDQRDYYEQ